MLDARDQFLLVDARNPQEYEDGHIPRALNVYDKEMPAHKASFPTDKNYPIVFYCNGYPKCLRSLHGAKMAWEWGYRKVSIYAAGFPEWESKGYPVERQ
jgi:rhodanese-related sulfurtransferase